MLSTLFVSMPSEDDLVCYALHLLEAVGCNTKLLKPGELAPPTAVALFKAPDWVRWPSSHLRAAAHVVKPFAPSWAAATPFVVAVRHHTNPRGNFTDAVISMARSYEHWFVSKGRGLPWGQEPSVNTAGVQAWRLAVADLMVTLDEPWERTPALWDTPEKKKRERHRRVPPELLLDRHAGQRLSYDSAF